LEQQGIQYAESEIVDDRIDSVEDLLDQLADTDLVIAPRYHNLLLAMMLNKPVISLSYDPKNDALLEGVGLARFCQPLDEMDVDKLIKQFIEMEKNLRALADPLPKKLMEYRTLLDQQYIRVLGDL
jgi:polysaccharide pyruvyl transferase WcaK-like protein